MDQGMAAARTDHRAVDRAAGPRGCGAAEAAAVGWRRWTQRRGDRGARAIAGKMGRPCGAQATAGAALLPTPLAALRVTWSLRGSNPHSPGRCGFRSVFKPAFTTRMRVLDIS